MNHFISEDAIKDIAKKNNQIDTTEDLSTYSSAPLYRINRSYPSNPFFHLQQARAKLPTDLSTRLAGVCSVGHKLKDNTRVINTRYTERLNLATLSEDYEMSGAPGTHPDEASDKVITGAADPNVEVLINLDEEDQSAIPDIQIPMPISAQLGANLAEMAKSLTAGIVPTSPQAMKDILADLSADLDKSLNTDNLAQAAKEFEEQMASERRALPPIIRSIVSPLPTTVDDSAAGPSGARPALTGLIAETPAPPPSLSSTETQRENVGGDKADDPQAGTFHIRYPHPSGWDEWTLLMTKEQHAARLYRAILTRELAILVDHNWISSLVSLHRNTEIVLKAIRKDINTLMQAETHDLDKINDLLQLKEQLKYGYLIHGIGAKSYDEAVAKVIQACINYFVTYQDTELKRMQTRTEKIPGMVYELLKDMMKPQELQLQEVVQAYNRDSAATRNHEEQVKQLTDQVKELNTMVAELTVQMTALTRTVSNAKFISAQPSLTTDFRLDKDQPAPATASAAMPCIAETVRVPVTKRIGLVALKEIIDSDLSKLIGEAIGNRDELLMTKLASDQTLNNFVRSVQAFFKEDLGLRHVLALYMCTDSNCHKHIAATYERVKPIIDSAPPNTTNILVYMIKELLKNIPQPAPIIAPTRSVSSVSHISVPAELADQFED